MTLKLVDGKVLISTMFVPELKEHTFVNLVLETNTEHLKPVIYIDDIRFETSVINLKEDIKSKEIVIKVELLDHQNKIIHIYQSKVAYNVYQILGDKPIRPDIEQYLYSLEEEIRYLKNEIVLLMLKHKEEMTALVEKFELVIEELKLEIKTLEEKGEII
jgi:hypothetical protein